jgi:hypothetical protein
MEEIDFHGVKGPATERGQLVQHARTHAEKLLVCLLAKPRDLQAVLERELRQGAADVALGRGTRTRLRELVGPQFAHGQRHGHLERTAAAEAGAGRDGAVEGEVEAGEIDAAPAQPVQHGLHVIRPRRSGAAPDFGDPEPFALIGEGGRRQLDAAILARRDGGEEVLIDGQRQGEAPVVVRVVPEQFEPARRPHDMHRRKAEGALEERADVQRPRVLRARHARASNFRARSKSLCVRPPASWVVSRNVTLFQRMSMSG